MSKADDSVKAKVLESLSENEFACYIGLEFLELEDKYIRARIPFRDKILNPYGSAHGGVLYALADITAGTLACFSGKFVVTVDGHMNYLSSAEDTDYIYCEAKTVKSGKTLIVIKIKIKNDKGKLLDDGSFTFFKTDREMS